MATILVVDDHENFRAAMTRFLNMEGFFAIAVESGFRALEYLLHHTVDLVMIDYVMPEMDGITLMEKIQEAWPKLPLIMLTGYADSKSSHRAGLNGTLYLVKPIEGELLKTVLEQFLNRTQLKERLQVDDIELDLQSWESWCGKRELCLTEAEFKILACLMQAAKWTCTYHQIAQSMGVSISTERVKSSIKAQICTIRRKVKEVGSTIMIQNIRGVGYRLYVKRQKK